ncbi:MAG: hypothetical protein ACTSYL_12880 [Candidatus Thorarchaeota archaeon]
MNKTKILTLFAFVIMLVGTFSVVPGLPVTTVNTQAPTAEEPTIQDAVGDLDVMPQDMQDALASALPGDIDPGVDLTDDVGLVLQDNPNNYKVTYEPWKTKAAIHAIAYDEDSGFLALGGGYLYDNEVHIYRYNPTTGKFDKVWDSGDSIIKGDVLSLAIGDTDLNDFMEIIAASSDGRVYVFEQRHIYDPYANTENMFDHVWTSPYTFRAFSVTVDDVDRDYRPDIVVGSWDGKVRCFEYSNHSGYPFNEEHWITYDEVWNSGDTIDGRIYTVATGDTNNNGLPEIIAGTREGRVYVFENDGVTMWINGEPFPLINDNHYKVVWTSENYTWTPIMDMEAGELDGTPGEEIALVAQGQGVFVLDWNPSSQTYTYEKVYRPWDAWQSESPSPWRFDFWADSVVSANNVLYHLPNGTYINEPISYTMSGGVADPNAECYPFNTGLANETDGYYSLFDASDPSVDNATAIIDFGKDEEGTGSASADWDLDLTFRDSLMGSFYYSMNISVSQSGTDWEQVDKMRFSYAGTHLYVDVDDALSARHWDWFRYIKISVYANQSFAIDSIKLAQVYTQVTTALTVTIGPLPDAVSVTGPVDSGNKLLVGTVIGTILAFSHGSSYDLVWDSGTDDSFAVGTNIWDMVHVGGDSRLPFWLQFWYSYLTPPSGTNYVHWSLGDVDPLDWVGGVNPYNILLVNDANEIFVYTDTGSPSNVTLALDTTLTNLFTPIVTESGYSMQSVEMLLNPEDTTLPFAVVSYLSDDPSTGESFDFGGTMAGDLQFYYRSDSSSPYTSYLKVEQIDYTGDIVAALSKAKAGPYMEFVDWDGDGDQDMILSTGFLYYCENLGIPSGASHIKFKLHPGYFADINTGEMSYFWGQPTAADFDNDGDLDLVLGYVGKPGFTYWENTGTMNAPTWVQNKRLFKNTDPEASFRYQEYYDIRVAPMGHALPADTGEMYASILNWNAFVDKDYTLLAYKPSTNQLFNFWPIYDQSEGYVVATYPEVKRYELMPRDGETVHNFGFHVYETWSTTDDLNGWTLSVTSDDVDGDGKGELIVGDYDNNVYIFEHMVNNSYKRAFRSFDINYTEESTTSPYYWQELEGISGSFKRVIWNHVDHVLAGMDIDRDGRQELVAAAGMQLYVFESTGIDDTYRLAYTIDFRSSQFNTTVGWNYVDGITALASADDLDYNHMNELIVGLGPYLFVFNVPYNGWDSTDEYFMGDALEGRHYLLGNGADNSYRHAKIQAIITGDTDEDGYRELIIGGELNVTQSRSDGFVKIYEWTGLLFEEVWNAPSELTYWNPVTDIAIDDQDFDSRQELIIGHSKGFDVWEWNGTDSGYDKVEYVTSSPNYPYIGMKTVRNNPEPNTLLTSRGQNDIAYIFNDYDFIVGVYVNVTSNSYARIYWRVYYPSIGMWSNGDQLFPTTYAHFPSYTVYNEMDPSLYYHSNGTLYITWRTRMWTGSGDQWDFWWSKYDRNTFSWIEPQHITDAQYRRQSKIYLLSDGTLGIAYLSSTLNRLFWGYYNPATSSWSVSHILYYKDYTSYYVTSFDMARMNDDGWAIAVSARNSSVSKTDLDIYVMTSNSSWNFADSHMYAATSSYLDEMYPDLGQLGNPENNLMVVYEVPNAELPDSVQMSYSLTGTYAMWRKGEPLASIPDFIVRLDNGDGTTSYYCRNSTGYLVPILNPYVYSPSVLGLRNGGFMNTYVFDFSTRTIYDPSLPSGGILDTSNPYYTYKLYHEYADFVYGINPSSRFTHYNIRGVVDLDVGDTDGDNRREVTVGFDDRAATYELVSSNGANGAMEHREAWLSDPFDHDVTGVTVYDLNGNGFEEIGVSCERGDVFVFEVDNSATRPLDLHLASLQWNNTGGTDLYNGFRQRLVVADIDGDGYDEIIRGEYNGSVRAFDHDGTEIWSNNDFTGYVYDMALANTSTGLVLAVSYERFNYTLIDVATGLTLWNTTFPGFSLTLFTTTYYPGRVIFGDVSDAPGTEIIGTNTADAVRVWAQNGTMLWSTDFGTGYFTTAVVVGNFSGRDYLDIAIVHVNHTMTFLYGNNGSIIRHLEGDYGFSFVSPVVFDYNGDGYDDVAIANRRLAVVDGHTGNMLYNSTVELAEDIEEIWISSFDDDLQPEALLRTDKGVYYEEISSGRQVWSYKPLGSPLAKGYLGTFSDGRLGLALALNNGCLVALDALTGLPIYFEIAEVQFDGVAAADIDGDGVDELVGSTTTGQLLAYDEIVPGTKEPPEVFSAWNQYWYQDINQTVRLMYRHNLNTDPQDELVILDGSEIRAFATDYPLTLWNYSVHGLIYDIAFGDLSGDGHDDILAYYLRLPENIFGVFALDGMTGVPIAAINESYGSGTVNAIAVGDFNQGTSGNEYVVVMKYGSATGAAVYDNTGTKLYTTSTNTSSNAFAVVTGEFDGAAGLDFAFGTTSEVMFYSGDCTYGGAYTAGGTLVKMATGNFNGDSYTDVVAASADGSVRTINGQTLTYFWYHPYGYTVDGLAVGEFDTMISNDEIMLSLRGHGVLVVRSDAYFELSSLNVASPQYIWLTTGDVDGNGKQDVVLVQDAQLSIYEVETWTNLAVYSSWRTIYGVVLGNFDGEGSLDLALNYDTRLQVVTNGTRPTPPLFLADVAPADVTGLGLTTVAFASGLPLILGITVLIKRRRRIIN